MADVIDQMVLQRQGTFTPNRPILIVGMEAAGGALASQLAAISWQRGRASTQPPFVYAYLRKNRKSSGTKQQLEGPVAAALEKRFEGRGGL